MWNSDIAAPIKPPVFPVGPGSWRRLFLFAIFSRRLTKANSFIGNGFVYLNDDRVVMAENRGSHPQGGESMVCQSQFLVRSLMHFWTPNIPSKSSWNGKGAEILCGCNRLHSGLVFPPLFLLFHALNLLFISMFVLPLSLGALAGPVMVLSVT